MALNPYYTGPVSDHFDGERFSNPGQVESLPRIRPSVLTILGWWWRARQRRTEWPKQVPVQPALPEKRVDGLRVTPVGHSSVLIQLDGRNLLTDPVWSRRASPMWFAGPKRVTAPGIRLADLPPIDAVLLSHNHYDHFDIATLKRLHRKHRPLFVTPLGNDTLLRRHIRNANIAVGDWGDRLDVAGLSVDLVPSFHWSARWLKDRRAALWGGFVIRNDARTVYYVGDTAYGDGSVFRDIARLGAPPDLAIIPIGAYKPRDFMRGSHVDPTEAVQIFTDCGAKRAIGVHWGTFQLSDEAYDAPPADLGEALDRAGIARERFTAARPGEALDIS